MSLEDGLRLLAPGAGGGSAALAFEAPRIPLLSAATGRSMSDEEARDPAQWAGGAPDSKNFAGALRAACEGAFRMLVVAGPCAASSALAEGTLGRGGHGEVTQSLPDHTQPQSDLDVMASACACLWQAGVSLDWSLCGTGGAVRRVSLPGTVFRRRRHWIDPPARVAEEHRGRRSSASPASPAALEVELARLVSKLSGREIGPDRAEATFVALGFDSLFLGRVSAALSAEYGVRIGLRLLLSEAPTIRALARCLAREIAAQDTAQAGGQAGGQGAGDTAPVLLPAAGSVPSKARLATLQKRLDRHWRALGLGPGGAPARSERGGTAGSASGPPGGAALPSTEGQKEIWMAHQLGDAPACAFNETVVLTLDGPLDHDALAAALLDLVARHDALRLRFARSGESFEVLPPFAPDLPLLDLTGDAEVGLARLLDEEAAAPIDLSAGAPLRLRLVRLGATRHALVVTIHHIACDGQSRAIVLSDLGALYAARIAGRPAALPPAPSFAAHAAASGGEVPQADLAWWAAHLADPPSLPDLPTDHPRPQRRSHSGASLSVELPATVFDAARQAGAGHGCTAFGTLFAAAQIVLSRLSGARDVILGVPVSVRGRLADPALVGHCVNFIPVRVPLDPEAPAAAHLAAVGGALPEALERGDVTLGTLLRALDLPRDLSRQPLTEVRINLERDIGPLDFGPLRASARAAPRRAVNFDLVLNFVERTDGLRLDLDYNAALFTEATMRRWAGYLRRVLEGLAEDAARPVAALPLLGPEEERALVDGANATRAHYPRERSVDDLFRERSAARPEAVAVEDGTRRLSYGDLDALADAVAAALQSRLPRVGARVALSVPRDARLPACLLGILRAGHAYVPLDPGQPEARRMQVIEAARVDALLATEETGFEAGVPMIDVGAIAPGPRAAPVEVDPEAPAYIIFTSGSTGTPKGVAVPHRAMVNFLAAMIAEPGLTAADRLIAVTTVSFDISVLELFGPLLAGGVVRVASREEVLEGRPVVDEINSGRASVLQATPTLFGLLLDAGLAPPAGVRLLAGGEPVPFDLAERLMAGGAEMWNMYGPTETTVWSAARRLTPDGPITIGGPIANTELHVLDDAGRLLPPGAVGELNIGGDGLALGYFVRDDLTDAAFREVTLAGRARRLYRTGDLARRLPSGEIVVLGRRDGQVKLRGFRIELGEIESHLRAHDSVKAAAVDKRRVGGDDRLVAWLVPKADRRIDGAALARYLRARLPDYMVPQGWSVLDALPQTANGKLDRKALPTPEMGRALAAVPDAPAQAPQSVMEARLAAIWAEVLGRERIDPEATLFQIGADSLDVVRIAARQMAEGLDLETRDVLAHPSIRALAAHAEAKAPASEARRPSLAAFRDGARRPVRRAS